MQATAVELAVTLLLAAHLLAMNVASVGPLVGGWLLHSGKRSPDPRDASAAFDAAAGSFQRSLIGLVLGSLLGASLLLVPNQALRAALARFPSDAYWFAGAELLFSAGCIFALLVGTATGRRRPWLASIVAALSATNLLYHFPPLMAVLGELTADPNWTSTGVLRRRDLLPLWIRPEVLSLWLHFVLASMAVACVAPAFPYSFTGPGALGERSKYDAYSRIARPLAIGSLIATLLQIPVGIWLLSTESEGALSSMMGSDVIASLCFIGGLAAAAWLLQSLFSAAMGDLRSLVRSGWLLAAVAVFMSGTLRASRRADARDKGVHVATPGLNDWQRASRAE